MGPIHDRLRERRPMTPRDRRALMLGGVLVLVAVLGLRVVPWTAGRAFAEHAELEQRALALGRAREELRALPALRDSTRILTAALVALARQVLSGGTATEAGADLSGRVNLLVSRAPGKVERLELLATPDSTGWGRLGRTRVHALIETDVRGLLALLRGLETGDEVLTLEELRVVATDPAVSERFPELLKVEVTVSGWYIKPRPVKANT